MEYRTPQNSPVSSGTRGRRNNPFARLPGVEDAQADGMVEESEWESPLGEENGNKEPSDPLLLQGRHKISPTKIMDCKRRYLGRLVGRRLDILIELTRHYRGEDIGGEEWELLDELEAIGRAEEVVRRLVYD